MLQFLILALILFAFLLIKRITGIAAFPFAMVVLSEDRDTPMVKGEFFNYGVATGVKIFAGSIVVLNSSGYAKPAVTATGLIAVGRAEEQVDNTLGQNGDLTVNVREGVFQFANSADTDLITIVEIGDTCYLVDDQTVAKTSGTNTRSVAGYIRNVDADGVWVKFYNTQSADGDVVAANNLSDVTAATARENLGANLLTLQLIIADLVASDAKVYRVVAPCGGTIYKIYSVLEGHALAVGDATLTAKIGATGVTGGVITITQAGSAVGDMDVATPSALKTVVPGDVVSVTVGGANTDTAATAKVTILIKT